MERNTRKFDENPTIIKEVIVGKVWLFCAKLLLTKGSNVSATSVYSTRTCL